MLAWLTRLVHRGGRRRVTVNRHQRRRSEALARRADRHR